MEVHHTLICVLFLMLQDGHTGLSDAKIPVYTATEGGNITVKCVFDSSETRNYFCKGTWRSCDTLIETHGNRAQKGRYSIEYKTTPSGGVMYVSITQLTKSDSGQYGCGLDKPLAPDPYVEFKISVGDAPSISKPNWTLRPSLTSVPSASTTTTQQSLRSTFSIFTKTSSQTEQHQTETTTSRGVLLYVGLSLVITVILLSLGVLILCREKAAKPKEGAAETVYADVTEIHPVYEEIDEERRQSSSPVEVSTVYTCAKYTKPNGQTTDEYSLVTATCAQSQTEEDSSKLVYSELDFPKGAAPALGGAPCVNADKVVYSVPR